MDTSTSSNVNLPKIFYIWTDEFLTIYVLQNGLHIFHWLLEHFLPLDHQLLQNDYCFFVGSSFWRYKMKIGFYHPKINQKNTCYKMTNRCVCNKMHFTSPFFFYQFRVRWHSVVSISSPFLWWKFKGGCWNNILGDSYGSGMGNSMGKGSHHWGPLKIPRIIDMFLWRCDNFRGDIYLFAAGDR